MSLGNLKNFTTWLKNNLAASSVVHASSVVLRKSVRNNKDRFEVMNLWEFVDEVRKDAFPRLL